MADAPSVVGLETRHLRFDLARPWGPDVTHNHLIVVDVTTSDGVQGTGVSWTPRVGPEAIRALIDHDLRPTVVGGPADPEVVWDRLWAQLHEGGSGGLTTMAIAGIDLALWDAKGRRQGCSLPSLIGRRRASVDTYGSGINLHYPLDDLLAQVERWVATGHGAVKVKVGRPDLAEDVERIAAVREVLGPGRRLMIDANQRWDLPTARRAIAALTPFDLSWVEEPLLSDLTDGYAQLRSSIDVPVALGENVHTLHRFHDLFTAGACDIAQPNVVRVGGITPFLRIAELATAHGVTVVPHLLPELSAQLAVCLPGTPLIEDVEDASFGALGALRWPSGVTLSGGRAEVADRPGLGLEFIEVTQDG